MSIKLGSLFDGIGGFPYSGIKFGITPAWASEIEPWPIKVTEKHFPGIKHLGDITQINGGEIEPVDIITFGSPCQDLSVAGKREGLAGARSGLFMEAVRIIREMRTATDGQYPRFAVWENVPGAFSSNKCEDFRAVLEEIAEAEIPMPPSGKWGRAGMVRTERVDVAWRTLDAQYWGVPQRRRRIFLVADFAGQCAGEILFVEESLRGDFAESRETREEAAGNAGDGTKGTSGNLAYSFDSLASNSMKSKNPHSGGRFVEISKTLDSTTPEPSKNQGGIAILQAREEVAATVGGGIKTAGGNDVTATLTASYGTKWNGNSGADTGDNFVLSGVKGTDYLTGWDCQEKRIFSDKGVAPTISGSDGGGGRTGVGYVATASYWDGGQISDCLDCSMLAKGQMMPEKRRFPAVVLADHTLDSLGNHAVAVDCRNLCENEELSATIQSKSNGGYSLNYQNPVRIGYAVRRLTPLECLRLQGFPDYWLDIEGMSDTQKYKAVGNSVAIPCVKFVLGGIARVLGGEKK